MDPKAARKKELRLIVLCLTAIIALQCCAPYIAVAYQQTLFSPLQVLRSAVLNPIPFSIGDCLYFLFILLLLRYCYRRLRRARQKGPQFPGWLALIRRSLALYLFLLLLWGILYEQPKLYHTLALPDAHTLTRNDLIAFDSLLIDRMNRWQPAYRYTGLRDCNKLLSEQYRRSGARMRTHAKPTLLGNTLAYFGIQGYYNPLTGEAQVNTGEPAFMMPFLIAHEMAHQTGIAAEDDANLAAYIHCMESADNHLRYSACFNVWLYVHRKVRAIDTVRAASLKRSLNPVTLAQVDTLRERARRYHTLLDDASSLLFDLYLKTEQQEAGIQTYRNVAWSALAWEKAKK